MSRVAKLKPEKAKVKVVFRLQFHATHIPQPGWEKLFVSFIPADSGKATAKTTKANVKNGNCKWSDPIYETTRLLQDPKTKQYDEKLYKFVVAMGSSRTSVLGEATINLANFADASKPSSVSLSLHGNNLGTLLHVTVQLLTSKTGFREFEQQRELRERRFHMTTVPSALDEYTQGVSASSDVPSDQVDKANARVRFKSDSMELPSLEEEGELIEDYTESAMGIDGSSHTSDSFYAEKHDISSTHEVDSLKSTMSGDIVGFSLSQVSQPEKVVTCDPHLLAPGSNDWIHRWSSEYSMGNDLSTSYEENDRLKGSLENAEASIQEIKQEVSSLQRHADQLGAETMGFAQKLDSEIASGEELAREVFILKSECSKLKVVFEQHKHSEQFVPKTALEGCHATNYLSDASDMRRQEISELLCELEESKAERNTLVKKMDQMECYYEALIQELETNQKQMINELQNLRNEHTTCRYTISTMETQMEQMHLDMNEQLSRFAEERRDLDALNKELEKRAMASETTFKRLRWNYTVAVDQLQKDLELLSFQILSMFETNENLARKALVDASELCFQEYIQEDLVKNILEQQFSIRAHGIQGGNEEAKKDEQGISSNSNAQLSCPRNILKSKLHPSQPGVAELKEQVSDEDSLVNRNEKSLQLLEETQNKADAELSEIYLQNVHLGLFSNILQETLREACREVKLMKENINLLTKQLEHSTEFKEMLTLKVQSTLDDVEALRDSEARCIRKCNNLASENYAMETKLKSFSDENCLLVKKLAECEGFIIECRSYKRKYEACTAEMKELLKSSEQDNLEKSLLESQLSSVLEEMKTLKAEFVKESAAKVDLEKTVNFLQDKIGNLSSSMISYSKQINAPTSVSKFSQQEMEKMNLMTTILHLEELQHGAYEYVLQLSQEKKNIEEQKKNVEEQRDIAWQSVSSKESEILLLKEKFESDVQGLLTKLDEAKFDAERLQLELQDLVDSLNTSNEAKERYANKNRDLSSKLVELETELQFWTSENSKCTQKILLCEKTSNEAVENNRELSSRLSDLETDLQLCTNKNRDLTRKIITFEKTSSEAAEKNSELSSKLAELEIELQLVTSKNRDLDQKTLTLDSVEKELEKLKFAFSDCLQENKALMHSLKTGNEESVQLSNELNSVKESLGRTCDILQAEKRMRDELEVRVRDLTSELNEKNDQLLSFANQKDELIHIRQQVADLHLENSRMKHNLLLSEESQKKVIEDASVLCSQVADMEATSVAMHECLLAADIELVFTKSQLQLSMQEQHGQRYSKTQSREIPLKHVDVVTNLGMISEPQYVEENLRLIMAHDSLKSELEKNVSENRKLELELCQTRAIMVEDDGTQEKQRHDAEIEELTGMLTKLEEEMDHMRTNRDELEITVMVLKSKLDEQQAEVSLQQMYHDDMVRLQKEHDELIHKLSEQDLKTEEFKKLSIHLKELKDKAEAECLQTREKREYEGPSTSAQESLRIAFIREQCDNKLQELRGQLFASKKHGEEMLLKLQAALDELESRKKCEASLAMHNEHLSLKILELENEIKMILAEKREKVKAYDRMKAELECSMISLDCCKEEKLKLEMSLQECNEERTKIAAELDLINGVLEYSASWENIQEQRDHGPGVPNSLQPLSGVEITFQDTIDESGRTRLEKRQQNSQDCLALKRTLEFSRQMLVKRESLLQNNMKHIALISEHFTEQNLKPSIDRLHRELERLKDENSDSLLPLDEHEVDPASQGLQSELLQLHLANERLGTIFPLFKEFSSNGNALERVLALEIELAEALQSKKKSSIHFQSSFLKQHNDDEAVFQSFRDINELIKDMLELKRRHHAVENDLKEMHDRYSQLSLQFAEVEGERQKLVMTLKNIRLPKKP